MSSLQKGCPLVGVASQGQLMSDEKLSDKSNHPTCEQCGVRFEFDDETGYFYHPLSKIQINTEVVKINDIHRYIIMAISSYERRASFVGIAHYGTNLPDDCPVNVKKCKYTTDQLFSALNELMDIGIVELEKVNMDGPGPTAFFYLLSEKYKEILGK